MASNLRPWRRIYVRGTFVAAAVTEKKNPLWRRRRSASEKKNWTLCLVTPVVVEFNGRIQNRRHYALSPGLGRTCAKFYVIFREFFVIFFVKVNRIYVRGVEFTSVASNLRPWHFCGGGGNGNKWLMKTWHDFRFLAACCAPPPKIEKNA